MSNQSDDRDASPKGTRAKHFGQLRNDLFTAAVIGAVVALCVGSATFAMGNVGDAEARQVLEAIIPSSRLFCSSILTVSATVLALMLTIIGLGHNANAGLADAHYHRIIKIALYDAVLFAAGTIVFVLHCVPIYESDAIPSWWYPTIYYGVLITLATLAGGAVSIVTLLYLAVKDVVEVVALGKSDHLYAACDPDEHDSDEHDSEDRAEACDANRGGDRSKRVKLDERPED